MAQQHTGIRQAIDLAPQRVGIQQRRQHKYRQEEAPTIRKSLREQDNLETVVRKPLCSLLWVLP